MAGIPQNFQAISNVLANYNFVDLAAGTGYITFYGGKTVDLNLMSNFTYYSDTVCTATDVVHRNDVNVLVADVDFDVLLNRPLDVVGTGIFCLPIETPPSCASCTLYAVIYFRKWDGVTETTIVNNTSRSQYGVGAVFSMLTTDLIIPLTHFKKGETMRLSFMIYASDGAAGSDGPAYYAHDPKGRTTGWDTTGAVPSQLSFQCPVRLNL